MKTIRILEPGKVAVDQVEAPEPKAGEALLKVLYGGICGSDLSAYRGVFAYFSYPRTPGHEFSAEIVRIGENDRGLKAGMVVTANPYFNCGHCYSCEHGLTNACMDNQTMGVQREGAFSDYITMPVSRIIDGKGLDPKTLTLIEPFCIGYHGIQRAGVNPGDRVLIVGAGTIGVLAAMSAKMQGAKVYITDVAQPKLDYAMKRGLDGCFLNSSPEAFNRQVAETTSGNGFDVTVECVGLPSTFQNCLDAACFGGRVVVVGVGKHNIDLDFTVIQKKELNIFGSRNALTSDFEELIDFVLRHELHLQELVTSVFPVSRAAEAFETLHQHAGEMLKVLLDFQS